MTIRQLGSALLVIAALSVSGFAAELAVQTLAGPVGGVGSLDAHSNGARFNHPRGITFDSNYNLYVSDTDNHTIRYLYYDGQTNDYVTTTFAGEAGVPGSSNGVGGAAHFNSPDGLVLDSAGNLFVSDAGNHTIRKISPTGLVTTFAGLAGTPGSDDGPGNAALFNTPRALAIDASDNLFVADSLNHTIRKITPDGVVSTYAGTPGIFGSTDGPSDTAQFNQPNGVTIDPTGIVYVADTLNQTIRAIGLDGTVSTLAGTAATPGFVDGPPDVALFHNPSGVAYSIGYDNNFNLQPFVYITDTLNHSIRQVDPATGNVQSYQGNMPGTLSFEAASRSFNDLLEGNLVQPRTKKSNLFHTFSMQPPPQPGSFDPFPGGYNSPTGIAASNLNNPVVFVADTGNSLIRQIFFGEGVSTQTIGGQVDAQDYRDAGQHDARLYNPIGACIDGSGNLIVSDGIAHTLRSIAPDGNVLTLTGQRFTSGSDTGINGTLNNPTGLSYLSATGVIYIADTYNNAIRTYDPTNGILDFAGQDGVAGSTDDTLSMALFNAPQGVYAEPAGAFVYVADSGNHTIRAISNVNQQVSTLAGIAGMVGSTDGPVASALFNNPTSITGDAAGNLYIADTDNHTIRKIDTLNNVSTIAGLALTPGSSDGTGSAALFNYPTGLLVTGTSLYVSDAGNNTIRTIDLTSFAVNTVAGQAPLAGGQDGNGSAARFNNPTAIATADGLTFYIVDSLNNNIRTASQIISDMATIDQPVGAVNDQRQLGVANPSNKAIYSWSIIRQPAFSLATISDPASQNPTFTPDVTDEYVFQLVANGPGGASITNVTLNVVPPAPTITSPNTASAMQGQSFTYTITADNNPVTFNATNLPPGLTVDTDTGIISGTPTTFGTVMIGLQATNPGGTGNGTLTLTINPGPPVITSPLTATTKQGSFFTYTVTASNAPESITATNLPANLTYDPATSTISGIPATVGTFNITLTASNEAGSDTETLVLKVITPLSPVITLLASDSNPGFIGAPVNFTFSATDADSPTLSYTFSAGENQSVIGSFAQGTVVSIPHTYAQPGDYTVRLIVTDGGTIVSQTLLESIPAPASGGTGIPNISNQTDTVTNPLDGLTISVINSDGGVIQLGIDINSLTRASYDVSTDWGDISGRSSKSSGLRPVHQYVHHGIFIAKVVAVNKTTGTIAGSGRKTLTISTKETGEPAPDLQAADVGAGGKALREPKSLGDAPNTDIKTKSLSGKFVFNGTKTDIVTFNGSIQLPAGLDISVDHEFDLSIGNIVVNTVIGKGGRGKTPGTPPVLRTLQVRYPRIKKGALTVGGEIATVTATLNQTQMVAAGFNTEGVAANAGDAAFGKVASRKIQVSMLLDGVPYESLTPVNFTIGKNPDLGSISGRSLK